MLFFVKNIKSYIKRLINIGVMYSGRLADIIDWSPVRDKYLYKENKQAVNAITRFAKKVIDPEEGLNSEGIVKEIVKCGILILVSTFIFVQASTSSMQPART